MIIRRKKSFGYQLRRYCKSTFHKMEMVVGAEKINIPQTRVTNNEEFLFRYRSLDKTLGGAMAYLSRSVRAP